MDYISRDAALDIDVDVEVENEDDIDLIMRGMRIVIEHIKALPSADIRPPNPATNADRMRTLSDKEIAAVLHEDWCISSFGGSAECSFDIFPEEADPEEAKCYVCWLKWLKQEVKHE